MTSARDALTRLKDGNRRFTASLTGSDAIPGPGRRLELARDRKPFAIILGCSDARVPAEFVFDQGLGDLFVIRVAGNIVAPSLVGSVEFAAERFGAKLVVVLGHTECGAVAATLEVLQDPSANRSANLRAIVDRVRPSVEGLMETDLRHNLPALALQAARLNVRASADHLRHGSEVLEQLIHEAGLAVVGGLYDVGTGVVEFFDGDIA